MFPAKSVKAMLVPSGNETAKPIYRQTIVIKAPSQITIAPKIWGLADEGFVSLVPIGPICLFVGKTMNRSLTVHHTLCI